MKLSNGKKYMIIIITADNEDNWNKAADKKEKKYQKINERLLTRQAVVQCFYLCYEIWISV